MVVRALIIAAVVAVLSITTASASTTSGIHGDARASASGPRAATSLSKKVAKRRALERRRAAKRAARRKLLMQVRKNPRMVARQSFVRKAAAIDFELPMTLRFQQVVDDPPLTLGAPDDTIQVDPSNGFVTPPTFLTGVLAGPQVTTITGNVEVWATFADSRVAGSPGAMSLRVSSIDLTSTPVVIGQKECVPGSPVAFFKTGQIALTKNAVFVSSGEANLFSGALELTLNTNLTFNSYRDEDCDGIFDAGRISVTPDVPSQRPVSLRMLGQNLVSPAITKDGRVRFLLHLVDNSATPQPPFSQMVNACTTAPAPPAEVCLSTDPEAVQINTGFKALNISVEALIGQ